MGECFERFDGGHVLYGPRLQYALRGDAESVSIFPKHLCHFLRNAPRPTKKKKNYACAIAANFGRMRPPLGCKRPPLGCEQPPWFELLPLLNLGLR